MKYTMNKYLYNQPKLRGSVTNIRYPAVCEYKLDGIFQFIQTDNGIYLGELHYGEGKQGDLYKLLKDRNKGNILIFDVVMLNNEIVQNRPLSERKKAIVEAVGELSLPYSIVNSLKEAKQAFHDAVMEGYEGVVIKSLDSPLVLGSCSWVKMKFKDQNVLRITKIDPEERIEVDHVGVPVGVKVINRIKKDLNIGDSVVIEHYGVTVSGSLRNPIYIGKENGDENS